MKSLAISRNNELLVALRFSGFDGVFCKDLDSLKSEFLRASRDRDLGIIMLVESDFQELKSEVFKLRNMKRAPLVVTLPSREGFREEDFILKYVKEAVGLKLDR